MRILCIITIKNIIEMTLLKKKDIINLNLSSDILEVGDAITVQANI